MEVLFTLLLRRGLPASLLNLHCLDQEGICRRRDLEASAT